eukprot:COSAG05_NODE_23407_length_258_cov_0.654088_1_plen_44_part_10
MVPYTAAARVLISLAAEGKLRSCCPRVKPEKCTPPAEDEDEDSH